MDLWDLVRDHWVLKLHCQNWSCIQPQLRGQPSESLVWTFQVGLIGLLVLGDLGRGECESFDGLLMKNIIMWF